MNQRIGFYMRISIKLYLFLLFAYILKNIISLFPSCKNERNHILILRIDDLGDFFAWLYYARIIRECYPDSKITVCVKRYIYDFARICPFWDDIIVIDDAFFLKKKNSLAIRLKTLIRFAFIKADMAINPMTGSNVMFELMLYIVRAKKKIAFDRGFKKTLSWHPERRWLNIANRFYTHLLKHKGGNVFAEFAELTSVVIGKSVVPGLADLSFLDLEEKLVSGDYMIIAPGAGSIKKCWDIGNFVMLSDYLAEKYPSLKIVLTGFGKDDLLAAELAARSKNRNIINMSGKTSVLELCSLIRHSRLLVANDSGAIQIAGCLRQKTVDIWNGADWLFFDYSSILNNAKLENVYVYRVCFNCSGICYDENFGKPYPCVSDITPDMVISAVEKHLS